MLAFRCPVRSLRVVQTVICILLTSASMLAADANEQNRSAGPRKSGRIATAPYSGAPLATETLDYTVLPQVQIFVDAWVEYNPTTCAEISAGSWAVGTAPKRGVTATGTVTGTLADGDCPGDTFTFAAIYYTWTSTTAKGTSDAFAATWTSPDYSETDNVKITECGAPTIMFNGANVAGQTTSVVAGQEIMLTGQAPNAACVAATVSQQWLVPMEKGSATKNAVGGYTPTTTSYATASVTPLPTGTTATSYGPFYFTVPGTYTMTYQYTVNINGSLGTSPLSTATFTADGPTGTSVLVCGGAVDETGGGGCTASGALGKVAILGSSLYFGGTSGTNVGIAMTASATAPSGNFTWVQLITGDVITETPTGGGAAQTCNPPEVPAAGVFPGLDTAYTYPIINPALTTVYDNPPVGLGAGYNKVSRAFSAKMNLMWTPTADAACTGAGCTIPVPLGSVNWKVSATATLNAGGTWVPSGGGSAGAFVANTAYPTWTNWVTYSGPLVCH